MNFGDVRVIKSTHELNLAYRGFWMASFLQDAGDFFDGNMLLPHVVPSKCYGAETALSEKFDRLKMTGNFIIAQIRKLVMKTGQKILANVRMLNASLGLRQTGKFVRSVGAY